MTLINQAFKRKLMMLVIKYSMLLGLLKTGYSAKITEIEGKIPSITGLATTAGVNAVGNKIPSISNLVKIVDYNAKISDIESKYLFHLIVINL